MKHPRLAPILCLSLMALTLPMSYSQAEEVAPAPAETPKAEEKPEAITIKEMGSYSGDVFTEEDTKVKFTRPEKWQFRKEIPSGETDNAQKYFLSKYEPLLFISKYPRGRAGANPSVLILKATVPAELNGLSVAKASEKIRGQLLTAIKGKGSASGKPKVISKQGFVVAWSQVSLTLSGPEAVIPLRGTSRVTVFYSRGLEMTDIPEGKEFTKEEAEKLKVEQAKPLVLKEGTPFYIGIMNGANRGGDVESKNFVQMARDAFIYIPQVKIKKQEKKQTIIY